MNLTGNPVLDFILMLFVIVIGILSIRAGLKKDPKEFWMTISYRKSPPGRDEIKLTNIILGILMVLAGILNLIRIMTGSKGLLLILFH